MQSQIPTQWTCCAIIVQIRLADRVLQHSPMAKENNRTGTADAANSLLGAGIDAENGVPRQGEWRQPRPHSFGRHDASAGLANAANSCPGAGIAAENNAPCKCVEDPDWPGPAKSSIGLTRPEISGASNKASEDPGVASSLTAVPDQGIKYGKRPFDSRTQAIQGPYRVSGNVPILSVRRR
uniref:Uncharacterized protein n=1 Tax=Sphaerodactylus townsendi TaxID=933632 RepID=A0ACB8E675_9SAUR